MISALTMMMMMVTRNSPWSRLAAVLMLTLYCTELEYWVMLWSLDKWLDIRNQMVPVSTRCRSLKKGHVWRQSHCTLNEWNPDLVIINKIYLQNVCWETLHTILLSLSLIYKSLGLIHSPGKCISIINFVSIGEIKKTTGQDELKYLVWECNYSICIVIVTLAQTL